MKRTSYAILAVVVIALSVFAYHMITKDPVYDESVDNDIEKSNNLERDKERMWRLVPLATSDSTGATTYMVAPVSAINAASRVMESEKEAMIGMTQEEVFQHLNHKEGHRMSAYNFSFFPLSEEEKAIVLRFDCGSFGWQFDLLVGENDRVETIRRKWIH